MFVLLTVLALVSGLARSQTTCADEVDPNICHLLASESFGLKTVCTDPCLARMCKKTCGKCPLKCYSCHYVRSPADCQNIVTCPSGDHNCIVTESYNDNFEKVFQLGCALKGVCQNDFGVTSGQRSVLDGGCCESDLCNHNITHTPVTARPLAGIVLTTPAATAAPNSVVTVAPSAKANSPCADFNNELCTQLAFAMPDVCSNAATSCIASKVCPSMCGRCLSCFHCDNVQNPSDCQSITTCNTGQKCFITEKYNSLTFQQGFQTGCIDDNLCSNLTLGSPDVGSGPTLIGRRSHFHLSLDGDCCASDLCNDRIRTTQAPVVTTPGQAITNKPSGPNPQGCNWNGDCPPGFHLYQGKCYNFGLAEMEWDDALGYCTQRCSHLAELKTDDQLQNVMNYFRRHSSSGYNHIADYFIGAVDKGVGEWTWYNSGETVDSDIVVPEHHQHTTELCAVAMEVSVGDTFDHDFDYNAAPCTDRYRPLCEVIRQ